MNDYEAILAYAAFALALFGLALIWHRYRDTMKKRFHLLNYQAKGDDSKTEHPA
jgi:cbb3-type cytochrome oxidase subunit 3